MPTELPSEPCTNEIEVISRDFRDIDRQAECLNGYDQRYQQLSCGEFRGRFKTVVLDSKLGFYFEKVNQILDQSAAVPKNSYSIIFLMDGDEGCKTNGHAFSVHHLWYASPGSTFNGITEPGTHFAVIDLEKDFFERFIIGSYPELESRLVDHPFCILDNNETTAPKLRQTIKQILNVLQSRSNSLSNRLTTKSIRISIAEMIADRICHLEQPVLENRKLDLSGYFRIAKRARDYINDHRGIDISIHDLCRQTGVCRRTLEYSFRYSIGQSPAAYLRSIKLNEIRRVLLSPDHAEMSIGDIVADWGIWHLSRFANYYKKQFNELPSETRKMRQ